MEHAELIARLEAASEGGRDLDLSIAKAINACPQDAWLESGNAEVHWHEVHPFGSTVAYEPLSDRLAHYTTSVDAALTLVPEGTRVRELGQWWDVSRPGGWFCSIMRWQRVGLALVEDTYSFGVTDDDENMPPPAPSPALALCVAALKARQP